MLSLKDIASLFDKWWTAWRKLRERADKVPELEKRIGELEDKLDCALSGVLDSMTCRACRQGTVRIAVNYWQNAMFGVMQTTARICDICGHRDEETTDCRSLKLSDLPREEGE